MEEEGKKTERNVRLTEFRMTICERDKAEADAKWNAAEKKLIFEQENLARLEAKLEDRLWAEAIEAGKGGLE